MNSYHWCFLAALNQIENAEEYPDEEDNFIGPVVPSQYSKLTKKELGKVCYLLRITVHIIRKERVALNQEL